MTTPAESLATNSGRATTSHSGEWAILAGLRFALAMIVLCTHARNRFPHSFGDALLELIAWLGSSAAIVGFFLVSGYSIAASVGRHHDFYERRALRILPVYYICVAVAVAGFLLWPGSGRPPLRSLFVTLVFAQNVFGLHTFPGFSPAWTLTCEVVYYAVAPLLNKLTAPALTAVITLSVGLHLFRAFHPHGSYAQELRGYAIPGLAWAWLLGFAYYRYRSSRWALFALIASVPLTLADSAIGWGLGSVTIAVSVGIIIFARRIKPGEVLTKVLNYLGDCSYPLYLVQYPIICVIALRYVHASPYVSIGISILAAILINAVDAPIQRRRKQTHEWRDKKAEAAVAA